MIKKSASRNPRPKGVKVKHVLQILLLLCICFWLLYQIKCSYDRSREMSEKSSKTSVKEEDDSGGGLKLGRKDIREKQREEEDEESKDEDEGNQGEREDAEVDEDEMRREFERNEERERQEGKKEDDGDEEGMDNREEDEGREEEDGNNKMDEEVEDDRGGDDAEINEAEVEGGEMEIDHEEDFLDEDKGGREERVDDEGEEDNGGGDKEDRVVDDDIPEDKDPDEVGENAHEAREMHYQADDASNAVAHDTHGDDENADKDSNDTGMGDSLTSSRTGSLNEKESKPTRNVSVIGDTEFIGSVTNATESVIDLPQARRLTAPVRGGGDVSLEQTTGGKVDNASTGEKTQSASTTTYGSSYLTDSTPNTSTQEEPTKPLDPSNNQTVRVSDDVPNPDRKQEVDPDKENVIRMQLPDNHEGEESLTQ